MWNESLPGRLCETDPDKPSGPNLLRGHHFGSVIICMMEIGKGCRDMKLEKMKLQELLNINPPQINWRNPWLIIGGAFLLVIVIIALILIIVLV